jgi:N-acetyl-gamma-glutamyl-phosphate reductase
MLTKIGIVGSTGYTGLELVKLLKDRDGLDLFFLGSEQYEGKKYSEVFPQFIGEIENICQKNKLSELEKCDLVFFATPNGIAHKFAPELIEAGVHVIDLSADYRFRNLDIYRRWYGFERQDPKDIESNLDAIYALPEINKKSILETIKKQKEKKRGVLIGNPGCYTTASILALSPLLIDNKHEKFLDLKSIIIDAKSGSSGAGRKAVTEQLFSEVNESISPYKLAGKHRHTPELEMFFSEICEEEIIINFSPHLIPMTRGILVTCYINAEAHSTKSEEDTLRKIIKKFYEDEAEVELLDKGLDPKTLWVSGTNRALIQVEYDTRTSRVIVCCVIDNMIKGAAGQAIRNMELILKSFPN